MNTVKKEFIHLKLNDKVITRELPDKVSFFHQRLIEEMGTPYLVIENLQKNSTLQFLNNVHH